MNKKIGFLCSSTSMGGLELHMVHLAKWMQNRGWNIVFYAVKDTPLEKSAREQLPEVKHINRHRKYYDLANAFRLKQQLDADKVDVLLIRDNRDISVSVLAKRLSGNGVKLIYQQAMQIGMDKKDIFHTLRYSGIDAWLCQLQLLADQVREKTRFAQHKLHVVPLGLELARFEKKMDKNVARKLLNLPEEALILGIIGRLDPKKGQEFLIDAVAGLRKKHAEIHLLILGDPTKNEGAAYLSKLQKKAAGLGIETAVHFHPFMENPGPFYFAIDIFALASHSETYGMVTIEAMASGLPIVATDAGGTPEILDFGKTGRLFQPGNADEFSENVMQLLKNPAQAAELGSKAREKAFGKYAHAQECEKIEGVIKGLF